MKKLRFKKIFLLSFTIVAMLLLQACDRDLKPEMPCNFVQNNNLQRVSWKRHVPIRLFLHSSVPEAFHGDVKEAVAHWNQVVGRELIILESAYSSGPIAPKRDGYSVIYWFDSWEPNKSSEQARTTVYWSGNQIYEADIRVNELNFDFFSGEVPIFEAIHFKSLMIHELGHVMGLAHNSVNGSVMNVSLGHGTFRDEVGNPDKESLNCEY